MGSDQLPTAVDHLRCDGGDRSQDHVRDGLWLRDHDHVGALDFGDRRPGALGHGTDDITPGYLVCGRNHAQAGKIFQAGAPHGSENASSATERWVAAITTACAADRSAVQAVVKVCRIDGELYGGLRILSVG